VIGESLGEGGSVVGKYVNDLKGVLRGLLSHQYRRTGGQNKEKEKVREDFFHRMQACFIVASREWIQEGDSKSALS
jgi:hypothetical protein